MKIIIYNNLVYSGGVERLFPLFAESLKNRGHDITVMASPESKKEFKTAFSPDIHCIRSGLPRKKFDSKFKAGLYNIMGKAFKIIPFFRLKINKYDAAIAFKEGHVFKNALKIRARKRFAWIHADLTYFCNTLGFTIPFSSIEEFKKCLEKYDKVVCVSETTRKSVITMAGDTGNLCVRYNPIDWHRIRSLALEKNEFIKNDACPLIVSAGRLNPVKNYMLLLEACRIVHEKQSFEMWILGDGPDRKKMEKFINENNMSFVKLLDFQRNPFSVIKQADLYVSTSVSEACPLAVQEALILGVPVIAVKCSGIIETLNPAFGKLIDNSAEELADTIYQLLTNPEELDGYRKLIEEEYPLKQVFDERIDKICGLIEGSEE